MKVKQQRGGYSVEIPKKYLDAKSAIISLSTELEPQMVFEDKKPTEEVAAYKAWFAQKGLPPFIVKFNEQVELPEFLSVVSFDNLQGCEVGYNVYFRADGLKEVK